MTTTSSGPSRRTLVKGAAWSVPVVAVAGAAPAMANSPIPPNGLNGWVQLQRDCSWLGADFIIDGRGNYPDRGIWTFIPDPNADIELAQIVFFFNRNNLSFSGGGNGWTNLQRASALDGTSPAAGHYAYSATYSGGWTYRSTPAGQERWEASGDPYWSASDLSNCSSGVSAYARRTITVNGETVTFTRGPISV